MTTTLREKGVSFRKVKRVGIATVSVTYRSASAAGKITEVISKEFPLFSSPKSGERALLFSLNDDEQERIHEWATSQALETIRNRIDKFGVTEPLIQKQGKREIVIQLPGLKDPDRAIALIGKTAVLAFKLVDSDGDLQRAIGGRVPIGDELLYQRQVDATTGAISTVPFLIRKKILLTGDLLTDARVSIDTQYNEPYVSLTFNNAGAKRFDAVTAENVGQRLAIAVLAFKLVDSDGDLQRAIGGRVPIGDELLYQRQVDATTGAISTVPFLIRKKILLTGDLLTDARVSIDTQYNEPYVSLTFNNAGAKRFDAVTAENVGQRLAIILDGNVYSAPNINERISGGRAQISGNFTYEEATDLAIVLRAGALPAPVTIIQNVTVGPTLGRDSIKAGVRATIIGEFLVLLFMIIYYRLSGVIANIAMILNILMLLGAMAWFNATLTLPGIAGIILTIGMGVDSNVLIFERIKEELRAGRTPRSAVNAGYDNAWWTIVDAHVTTLITAAVLFQFGSGPIKGFAVTLSLGIMINLFTALVGTKLLLDILNQKFKIEKLSI